MLYLIDQICTTKGNNNALEWKINLFKLILPGEKLSIFSLNNDNFWDELDQITNDKQGSSRARYCPVRQLFAYAEQEFAQ